MIDNRSTPAEHPEHFYLAARLWREYLDLDSPLTAQDVTVMQALLDVAWLAMPEQERACSE